MRVCRYCGFEAEVKEREIETRDGDLVVEVSVEAMREEQRRLALDRERERKGAQTLEELREIGRRRGYKPGWAEHVWAARGGGRRPHAAATLGGMRA
jgi:hypothetical protein